MRQALILLYCLMSVFAQCAAQEHFDTTTISKFKETFVNKIVGKWCYNDEKKIIFSAYFMYKDDTVFCRYSNVTSNGKYINSADSDEDWAFQIPVNIFEDTSQYINTICYYDGSMFHLKLHYDFTHGSLIWKTLENDYPYSMIIPNKLALSRCAK